MNKAKVVKITLDDELEFDNGLRLKSNHNKDCCESHYLSLYDITYADFEGLEFDLTGEDFFERVEGYGIALIPLHGYPVRIPGYGYNNGYYSSDLELVLSDSEGVIKKVFDITSCQLISN